ncbi:ArsR/SmtB family transcription factor [Desulfatirhabdium butyrativorans]|uniref:ArsR/SmtB family transcription factor n=1 Tax=Desulfatirhabdium butyrativorans TaxID=340467 RepID=UPI0003FAB21C|nr:metalloregulator ArsR/SmtB family transcription factor [Desulfatirhabdium butyrativorans]
MENFLQIMKALSDVNRVKILKALQERSLCVCEMQRLLDLAQPTVSKHLKILESCELVKRNKDGLWVNYAAVESSRRPYVSILLAGLRHWLEDDPQIIKMREKLPLVNRYAIIGERSEAEPSEMVQTG